MIYVDIVYKSKLTGKWMTDTKEFNTPQMALRGMYAMRSKNIIIDGWRCDDPLDHEWLSYRFKL
jgi:hypothetical protein